MDATGATVSGMDSYAGVGEEGQRGKKKKGKRAHGLWWCAATTVLPHGGHHDNLKRRAAKGLG
jgi:hypothetical protein